VPEQLIAAVMSASGMMDNVAAFFGVSALVIVTPGQDTALTIRNTLAGDRVGGVFTAVGVSTGQASWALATSVGIGALLVASEPVFTAIKVVGSVYLVLLGARAIYDALRSPRKSAVDTPETSVGIAAVAAFRQGLLSNLSNPKMAAFFTSLLPQFAHSFSGLLTLGLVFSVMTLAWLTVYSLVVGKAQAVLRRPRVQRAIEATMGIALIALGARLVTEPG
jgi:threonine/homoserine/homoserine lactone efflux protein